MTDPTLTDLFSAPAVNAVTIPTAPIVNNNVIEHSDSESSDHSGSDSEPEPTTSSEPRKPSKKTVFTVIVRNVPIGIARHKLASLCVVKPLSIRFRSIPLSTTLSKQPDPSSDQSSKTSHISKKVAVYRSFNSSNSSAKRSTQQAYIEFSSLEHAQRSVSNIHLKTVSDHILFARLTTTEPNTTNSVFLGNLAPDTDEDSVYNVFSNVGEVFDVRINRGSDSLACIGTGYVEFKDPAFITAALALAGTVICGRPVRVEKCLSLSKQKRTKNFKSVERRKDKKEASAEGAKPFTKREGRSKSMNDTTEFGGHVSKPGVLNYLPKLNKGRVMKKNSRTVAINKNKLKKSS
ncbi:hypothetical protein RCL1_005778 [Eukaryota sp. TZLM3-RCL]